MVEPDCHPNQPAGFAPGSQTKARLAGTDLQGLAACDSAKNARENTTQNVTFIGVAA